MQRTKRTKKRPRRKARGESVRTLHARGEHDGYNYAITGKKRRHRKCTCPMPCEGRFRCQSRHHRGSRSTPWCRGGDGESCDVCWCIEDRKRERAELKRAMRAA